AVERARRRARPRRARSARKRRRTARPPPGRSARSGGNLRRKRARRLQVAAIESPEKLGLRPFSEVDEAKETWPRGARPVAIREAASEFRARFAVPENRIKGVRTVDIASAAYPVKFAFGGAAHTVNPYINIINRLVAVQYEDFDGDTRTLVYEPTVT